MSRYMLIRLFILFSLFASASQPTFAQFTDCSGQSEIPQVECEALVALYNATDGPNWIDNTGWLVTNTPCTWTGIFCSSGTVEEIVLGTNNLTGSIPSELSNLANMTTLALIRNQLSGFIPPALGQLANLQILFLNVNSLSGSIPPELGSLGNLTALSLRQNQLTGPIPAELGNLAQLEHLLLYGNSLSGAIPPELGNLASLGSLRLEDNSLSGAIPPALGQLVNLNTLYLYSNDLTGPIPPELGNLTNLHSLLLSSNQLSGLIPSQLGNLVNLRDLSLAVNQLTGSIPPELGNLVNLQLLALSSNPLGGTIPSELGDLANLQRLFLAGCQLAGSIPPELENLTNLQTLQLSGNALTGPIPPELGNLTNLSELALAFNQITGSIPSELGHIAGLEGVFLQFNLLTGSIPAELGNLTNLEHLNLSRNGLSDVVPLAVAEVGAAANSCDFTLNDPSLIIPATPEYLAIGADPICGLPLTPITPEDQIESLGNEVEDFVDAGVLEQGQGNALQVKLLTAIAKLEDGKPHVALNLLRAFINHVESLIKDGGLTDAQGQPLIDAAQAIIDSLQEESLIISKAESAAQSQSLSAAGLPNTYDLAPNYPNPFNPSTEIRFTLPEAGHVQLIVYNLMGREVVRLVDGSTPAGHHRVSWFAENMPSGMYIYRLTSGDFTASETMMLIK